MVLPVVELSPQQSAPPFRPFPANSVLLLLGVSALLLVQCCLRTSAQNFPLFQQQCPPGWEKDGGCSGVKFLCVDPREVCIQGLCCQPSKNIVPLNPAMPCPFGTVQDGTCQNLNFCWRPSETCIAGACCQPTDQIRNWGGIGGGGGIVGPGIGGGGGIVGPGIGGGAGGFGGIGGGLGCTDFDPSCPFFRAYCFSQAIVEACMMSCGLCSGGYGGYGGGIGGIGMGAGGLGLGGGGAGLMGSAGLLNSGLGLIGKKRK